MSCTYYYYFLMVVHRDYGISMDCCTVCCYNWDGLTCTIIVGTACQFLVSLSSDGYCLSVNRVGNSRIGFLSDSFVFCGRKSDSLLKKGESLPLLFKKERPSKEKREQFALGHEKGENCQKHKKNSFFSSESLTSLFCKE